MERLWDLSVSAVIFWPVSLAEAPLACLSCWADRSARLKEASATDSCLPVPSCCLFHHCAHPLGHLCLGAWPLPLRLPGFFASGFQLGLASGKKQREMRKRRKGWAVFSCSFAPGLCLDSLQVTSPPELQSSSCTISFPCPFSLGAGMTSSTHWFPDASASPSVPLTLPTTP